METSHVDWCQIRFRRLPTSNSVIQTSKKQTDDNTYRRIQNNDRLQFHYCPTVIYESYSPFEREAEHIMEYLNGLDTGELAERIGISATLAQSMKKRYSSFRIKQLEKYHLKHLPELFSKACLHLPYHQMRLRQHVRILESSLPFTDGYTLMTL